MVFSKCMITQESLACECPNCAVRDAVHLVEAGPVAGRAAFTDGGLDAGGTAAQ
jgi:hypothetical protein